MTGQMTLTEFTSKLASKEPTPGGGGAAAVIGAIGVALCAMVANLTSGKEKYRQYQSDIERIIARTDALSQRLLLLADRDAEAFAPLAKAYGIPKDAPNRDAVLESALKNACSVPFDILSEIENALCLLEEISVKGTKLAISDVGVAAAALRCAAESAALNVYANTKLLKGREYAERKNFETIAITERIEQRCIEVYGKVLNALEVMR